MLLMALIFTGSQYMNEVVGLDGAARAGAIVAANSALANANTATINANATKAVNQEQGCNCFTAVANQASCTTGMNCVWTVASTSPNNTPIEIVHVSYTVTSYLKFISNLSVTAQAGASA
ncbi:MAG: hypothetical protein QOK05_2816 [Chloroflexota bacterium]|jgi:hypothetical protein|nr:hypothetical protein [Chloroflexota bacterium]